MKSKKIIVWGICTIMAFTAMGCGITEKTADITPTPTPAPTATPVPPSPTPTPNVTATPAPKLIGQKTETARSIALTNASDTDLREIYIQVSGASDWGKNLIPAESSVKSTEEVQMYYEPSEETVYDMKLITKEATVYEIYSVDLDDMEKASLYIEDGSAYLTYKSLSTNNETSTSLIDSSDDSWEDTSSQEDEDVYDDSYYDDSYYDDSYYDDSYYDDSYYDDGYYDDSYDDDGSYDDDYYDDSYDDGSQDDYGDNTGGGIVWDEDGNWTEY